MKYAYNLSSSTPIIKKYKASAALAEGIIVIKSAANASGQMSTSTTTGIANALGLIVDNGMAAAAGGPITYSTTQGADEAVFGVAERGQEAAVAVADPHDAVLPVDDEHAQRRSGDRVEHALGGELEHRLGVDRQTGARHKCLLVGRSVCHPDTLTGWTTVVDAVGPAADAPALTAGFWRARAGPARSSR